MLILKSEGEVISGSQFNLLEILAPYENPNGAFLWQLTADIVNKRLWSSADSLDPYFHIFDVLSSTFFNPYKSHLIFSNYPPHPPKISSDGSLVYRPDLNVNVGGESRGIVFDPVFQEVYAVRRNNSVPSNTTVTATGILLRTKACTLSFILCVIITIIIIIYVITLYNDMTYNPHKSHLIFPNYPPQKQTYCRSTRFCIQHF